MMLAPPAPRAAAYTRSPTANDDGSLHEALRRAGNLVASATALAVTLDALPSIELPPSSASQVDQAQLRAVASLYLASELENAGVVPAVETLAGLGQSGGIGIDLGEAAPLVAQFWKTRNDRATRDERAACFGRLFGAGQSGGGAGFEEEMLELCEALYKLDEQATNATYGGMAQQARVRAAATRLVDRLAGAAGGITVFLAQEILKALHDALAILGTPDLRGAFAARDIWGVVSAIDGMTHTARADARTSARRGKAGMTVLAWLADAAVHLDDQGVVLVGLDHPVIEAAIDWMQATLELGEADASASPPPSAVSPPSVSRLPTSPWSAIA